MSNTSPLDVASNFKMNIFSLIDYLLDICNCDSDLLAARLAVKLIPDKIAIENFSHNVQNHRNQIETENEKYFLDEHGGNNIFNDFNKEKVIKFRDYWKRLDDDQKKCVWKYFKYFLKLSDRYIELLGA